MPRVAVRVLVVVAVALVYSLVALLVIDFERLKPTPPGLVFAQTNAVRDAARRGDASVCGMARPTVRMVAEGESVLAWVMLSGRVMPQAICLNRKGYLSDSGLQAVEQHQDELKWTWRELMLFALGFVGAVGFTSYRLWTRSPSRRRRPA